MLLRSLLTTFALLTGAFTIRAAAPDTLNSDLEGRFTHTIRPFIDNYCVKCHSGEKPKGQFDLSQYSDLESVVRDHSYWNLVLDMLAAKEMPPEDAEKQPTAEARAEVVAWIEAVRQEEARKNAGDPGIVLARRLSNSEYNYSIRDLTGVDIMPAREFPVDPANQEGFDNSGESLAMSPALLTKYLQAAREVASHAVFKPTSLVFSSHPMLVETDRDKYCINQIMDFYNRQDTDFSSYFAAAWKFKHRAALGVPNTSLAEVAAESGVSPKYLGTVWNFLEETAEEVGPGAKLQAMWRDIPAPRSGELAAAKAACDQMRDFVVQLRAKLEPRFPNLSAGRIGATSQPFLMWKNRQYASHRMGYDRGALQLDGKVQAQGSVPEDEPGAGNEFGPGRTTPVANKPGDPDLFVPSAERQRYEEAFARFSAVFPDAFYVAERGRNYLDRTRDRGRYLSAGFHNVMGYFRDDQPLYELMLDEGQKRDLDAMWQDLDYVAEGLGRTWIQFYFNESGEARGTGRESEGPRPSDFEITAEEMVRKVEQSYMSRVAGSSPVAVRAVEEHFKYVNDTLRWVDRARVESVPYHLADLQTFASRAYRRPLSQQERDDILGFYQSRRQDAGLDHEEAMRDAIVLVLMSPDFCYRVDLVEAGGREPGVVDAADLPAALRNALPLPDYALASRLSYFLWSSLPDEGLLARAAAGELRRPEVIAAEARRMLKDPRARGMAVEFGGNWLDFRRFEEHNAVDRERFSSFDNDLRQAMFEEPVRFIMDVVQEDRPVLDFLYARHTFVNPVLARHYEMPDPGVGSDEWVRVDDAGRYGRGGVLPMGVFLTQNAPGLRTSPVKRGYWVVKRVLGEHIPAPPAVVPELPRDEAKMDLSLREMLAQHREDPSCSSCHARFDSMGLALEGYDPVGRLRIQDLAGRPVDARAEYPGGAEGIGLDGLIQYVREQRQTDFVDNLSRKMLAYALGRSLMLSDEPTLEAMREQLAAESYRFSTLVESIVTSPQFMHKRGDQEIAQLQ